MMRQMILFFTCILLLMQAKAQRPQRGDRPAGAGNVEGGQGPGANAARGPKPYGEVITGKAETAPGLFTVHKIEDKFYFEIPDSILGRDILIVSRLSKAGVDMRQGQNAMSGYAGDQLNSTVVRFEKGPNNKIFMRDLSFSERSADSTREMFQVVMNSNIQPIALSLDVSAYHIDSLTGMQSTVVDITNTINSDNEIFFFGPSKNAFRIGAYQSDKSYPVSVKTYPINSEIRTVKTYTRAAAQSGPGTPPQGGGASPGPVTVELNTSIVLLPKEPMQSRFMDRRVGYFANGYTDFDLNPQSVKRVSVISRWRLEPQEKDIARYKRGELVEPKKPIIIYIDPATPAKWVPYLIQGINDWQVAFEKAGFKNAIIGKKAPTPEEDPSWSLEDARHSAIVYKPSSVPNASGPHIADPRSGEIIETHINWYHNIMKLVHDWYLIQCAAVDPRARKMIFDDELMGQLIRFVSSHEVGHTLGLRHNFGASAATPVENLRNKKWVEENGHTSSIMDYARFNYVAQPGDNITAKGLFPRIGDYDKWAIEWGYRWIPDGKSPTEEIPVLNKWVVEKLKERKYWFGNESDPDDPRAQNEDLGDDAMLAGEYGIKNLQYIMPNLVKWTTTKNEGYDDLRSMHQQLVSQFNRYIGHVSKNIAGRFEDLKTIEQAGVVYMPVSKTKQKEALAFLNKHVFIAPEWLFNKELISLAGISPVSVISNAQEAALGRLMSQATITKLINAEATWGADSSYPVTEYLGDLEKMIFTEAVNNQPVSIYRRNLQKSYINRLLDILKPPAPVNAPTQTGGRAGNSRVSENDNSDVISVVRGSLEELLLKLQNAASLSKDTMTKYHYGDVINRINNVMSEKV